MKWTGLRRLGWWALVTPAVIGVVFAWPMSSQVQNPFFIIPIIAASAVGAVVSRQRPDNAIGWVFLGLGALSGLLVVSVALTDWGVAQGGPLPWWAVGAAWLQSWVWFPMLYLITVPPLLLFPSGLMSGRWALALWGPLAAALTMAVYEASAPLIDVAWDASGDPSRQVPNPLAVSAVSHGGRAEDVLFQVCGTVLLAGVVAGIVSTGLRIKRSQGVERLQMRWFGFAVALFAGLVVLEIFYGEKSGLVWLMVVEALVISAFPVSCGVAIMRYRLYDIDRIISRTTSYAIVTGTLLVCYALIVTTVSSLLPESGSLAVAAATLLVAALFRPLLRRVRLVVDRRFDRDHYDAGLAVAEFSQLLQSARGVDEVLGDLESVVDRVFGPSARAVWVPAPLVEAPELA